MGAEDLLIRIRMPGDQENALRQALPSAVISVESQSTGHGDVAEYFELDDGTCVIELALIHCSAGDLELSVRFAVSQHNGVWELAAALVHVLATACGALVEIADEVPDNGRWSFQYPDFSALAGSVKAAASQKRAHWQQAYGVDERKATCVESLRRVIGRLSPS